MCFISIVLSLEFVPHLKNFRVTHLLYYLLVSVDGLSGSWFVIHSIPWKLFLLLLVISSGGRTFQESFSYYLVLEHSFH